jgi:hypothetical protein
MENFIENTEWEILLKFHKQVFTLIDEWIDLSIGEIRRMEAELKKDLDQVHFPLISPSRNWMNLIWKLEIKNISKTSPTSS